MAEYSPNLLTYLGLGLLQSAQRGPRQNLGSNLLSSLGQYGQAAGQYQQSEIQRKQADQQRQEFEQRQKMLAVDAQQQQAQQESLARIGESLMPPSPLNTEDARMRRAQIDYGVNVDPKSLAGMLGAEQTEEGQYGLTGVSGFVGKDPAVLQLNSKGPPRLAPLPPGFTLAQQQTAKDIGGDIALIPKYAGGGTDAPIAKTLAPNEGVPYKGAVAAATAEGSEFGKQRANVEGDVGGLDAMRSARALIDDGIYTGFYANAAKTLAKALPGVDKSKAARTEQFLSHVGNIVIPRLKEFGGSDTVEEMNYLRKIMAGEITMEKEALQKILLSAEAKVQRRIARLGSTSPSIGTVPSATFKGLSNEEFLKARPR